MNVEVTSRSWYRLFGHRQILYGAKDEVMLARYYCTVPPGIRRLDHSHSGRGVYVYLADVS